MGLELAWIIFTYSSCFSNCTAIGGCHITLLRSKFPESLTGWIPGKTSWFPYLAWVESVQGQALIGAALQGCVAFPAPILPQDVIAMETTTAPQEEPVVKPATPTLVLPVLDPGISAPEQLVEPKYLVAGSAIPVE